MLLQLLYLSVIGWLPGAALFRMPWLDRDRRAALPAEERTFWAVILSIGVSLAIVLALASVGRYTFGRLLAADVAVAFVAAVLSRGRLRLGPVSPRPGLAALLPIVLIALGLWRFFPPAEYIMGGKDPGVYVNEGIQIAQRGSLVLTDPVVAAVPPFARDLFFPSHERPDEDYYGIRFMGFFIKDPGAGTVVGQFPHLFPASMAIAYGIDGLTGARRTPGAWAILGLLAVYFAGARLAGRTAAFAGALLLALHAIQVWWAHYPNADIVMQALLFAAILANARAHVDEDRFFAPVAALLLGLLLFLRFDAVLGIAAVLASLALGAYKGQRLRLLFVVPLAVMVALAVPYYLGPMRAYADLPIIFLSHLPWWHYGLLALAAIGALAGWGWLSHNDGVRRRVAQWTPVVVIAIVILAALYALFLREPGGKLTDYDAYALRAFTSLYVTLPGILAALLGFGLLARRAFWRDPGLFATVATFSLFLFYKIRIVPEQFWMTRRFVPVILPGVLLFIGAAAFGGLHTRRLPLRVVRLAVGFVFLGLLANEYARASRPLLDHVEYAGLIPSLEKLAGLVEDDDLLVVESINAGGDMHVMALPLAYIYARNVLVLYSARPDKQTFSAFLDWAHTKYNRVLFAGGGGTDLLSHRYGVRPVASERFETPEYVTTPWHTSPRGVRRKDFDFGVYVFTPPASLEGLWFDLDVGVRDDLHVLRFHAKEESGGRTFRWTQDRSMVSVTVVNPNSRQVILWMNNGGRPPGVPPADVQVHLHGDLLGTVRVTDRFEEHALRIPPELAARAAAFGDPVELRLTTPTWNPHDTLGTPDDRDLGVMVDRVAVR